MKLINHVIRLKTATTLDFIDITDKIKSKLKKARHKKRGNKYTKSAYNHGSFSAGGGTFANYGYQKNAR